MSRILLVDCNNFYVSCERVFNPKLNKKPVVVLGSNDACIIARSNEAKALNIPMGAPAFEYEAIFKKHNVIVHSANFALYGDMSQRVMQTVAEYATDIEIYSVDEAFLRVASYATAFKDYHLEHAHHLKNQVKQKTGIPVSIGIGPTKTLSKIANRLAKKNPIYNGAFDITNHKDVDELLASVDVADVWGIGSRYAALLRNNKIFTACDLKYADERWVRKHMTLTGHKTLLELRGKSCLPLQECPEPKQSITVSRSFGKKVTNLSDAQEALAHYVACGAAKLRVQQSYATHVTVFALTTLYHEPKNYFHSLSCSLPLATHYTPDLIEAAQACLKAIFKRGVTYKKVGVIFSGLVPSDFLQMSALIPLKNRQQQINCMKAVDRVNDRWGRNKLFFAAEGIKRPWKMYQANKSACFTTNWHELLTIAT